MLAALLLYLAGAVLCLGLLNWMRIEVGESTSSTWSAVGYMSCLVWFLTLPMCAAACLAFGSIGLSYRFDR